MNLYETLLIDGVEFRVVKESDDPKLVGSFKCSCGQIIKKVKTISSHLKSKSHGTRLEWMAQNRPSVPRFLTN